MIHTVIAREQSFSVNWFVGNHRESKEAEQLVAEFLSGFPFRHSKEYTVRMNVCNIFNLMHLLIEHVWTGASPVYSDIGRTHRQYSSKSLKSITKTMAGFQREPLPKTLEFLHLLWDSMVYPAYGRIPDDIIATKPDWRAVCREHVLPKRHLETVLPVRRRCLPPCVLVWRCVVTLTSATETLQVISLSSSC